MPEVVNRTTERGIDDAWDAICDNEPWIDADVVADIVNEESRFLSSLPAIDDPHEQMNRIAALQHLVRTAQAALADETLTFAAGELQRQETEGVKTRDLGRGIADQIGFATRQSPTAARSDLAMHRNLRDRFPQTWAGYRAGDITQRQARVVVTQSSHLDHTSALAVDAAIATQLPGWNYQQTEQGTRHVVYAIDPRAFVQRRANAEKDRRVWTRPAPDCMVTLTALLPLTQGIAAYANLLTSADAVIAQGDERSKGQIMADLLVQRLTGQTTADAVPVDIILTMSDRTLLGHDTTPGWLDHHGPVTAEHARRIATGNGESDGDGHRSDEQAKAWIRRLFTDPITGIATTMDPRKRFFTGQAREFIARRDRTCTHPYCSAPIRHTDHIQPTANGGPTTLDNAQGLCAAGNLTKDLPGWHTTRDKTTGDTIITTPTGHHYRTSPTRQNGLPRTTFRE